MSKTILIVENDSALVKNLRGPLEKKGFHLEETLDGKKCFDGIHLVRPDLAILAVELSGGQNGYLICGKIKKDEELSNTRVLIMGNPAGFEQHQKLKARADEYVAKPVDIPALVKTAAKLIGLPG